MPGRLSSRARRSFRSIPEPPPRSIDEATRRLGRRRVVAFRRLDDRPRMTDGKFQMTGYSFGHRDSFVYHPAFAIRHPRSVLGHRAHGLAGEQPTGIGLTAGSVDSTSGPSAPAASGSRSLR